MSIELEREPWKKTPSLKELTLRLMFPEGEVDDFIDITVYMSVQVSATPTWRERFTSVEDLLTT